MVKGKKLGLLLSVSPESPNFGHAIALARSALRSGAQVYFYCIDDGVHAVGHPDLSALQADGMKLYACAYAAQRRSIAISEEALFSGLTIVRDLIVSTDRFVSFN